MKPGSAGPASSGMEPVILGREGAKRSRGRGQAGNICIRNPWPGHIQTVWGDPERYVPTYYARYNRIRTAGTGGLALLRQRRRLQAADGYFRILGRVDDVINVAGHRLGTKELETAALASTR